jgi:hypothetical protein
MLSDPMWVPDDLDVLISAAENGVLDERHDFDAKRQLPTSGKELAKDIAAMTTDGGSLVYGIGEDSEGRPRVPTPIELNGAAERIDQVAQNSIAPIPKLRFVRLRTPEDGSRGYLLVVIPASPEAPHQVTVGDDRRFYGRSDTGNRRLSEEEIARLYERRAARSRSRDALLDECVTSSPFGEPPAGELGFMHAFVRPAVPEEDLWERGIEARGEEKILLAELRETAASAARAQWGGTQLAGALNWRRHSDNTWSLASVTRHGGEEVDPRHAVRADLDMAGNASLFYGAAAERIERNGSAVFALFEKGLVLTLAQFLGLTGGLYAAAGFYGPVDVGMAVTGIAGAISAHSLGDLRFPGSPYGGRSARRTRRCDARELHENPRDMARFLTGRLFSALAGYDFDPLAED